MKEKKCVYCDTVFIAVEEQLICLKCHLKDEFIKVISKDDEPDGFFYSSDMKEKQLIQNAITITDIIKNGIHKKPEIVLSEIIVTVPYDNIIESVLQAGIEYGIKGYTVVETIGRLQALARLREGTPLWKKLLNGFAVAFVKALANDGKLNIADLPQAIETIYLEIKKK